MTTKKTKKTLTMLGQADLAKARGGLLLPAVQKVRAPVAPVQGGIDAHVKFDGISGESQ